MTYWAEQNAAKMLAKRRQGRGMTPYTMRYPTGKARVAAQSPSLILPYNGI
jgi:hypothetical protein